MKSKIAIVASEMIERSIFAIRGHKVMLDADLAKLYNVSTKVLNQAVKRNIRRFPSDFLFQLDLEEKEELVTICDHLKHLKYSSKLPHAFTEQGVAMLSGVLKSERAINVNIEIMRAFIKMKKMLISHEELALKVTDMEKRYDGNFKMVFNALKQLIEPPAIKRTPIGFRPEKK
jgi:hypothetical protein